LNSAPPYLLAAAGASIDAVVLLSSGVLTAAQTGNTMLFAVALAREDPATGLSAGISVAAFVAGTAAGAFGLARFRRGATAVLVCEGALLAALFAWSLAAPPGSGWGNGHVTLAALAMGLQSAFVRGAKVPFATTYVTGVLASGIAGFVEARVTGRTAGERAGGARPWEGVLVWAVYFAAALGCGALSLAVGGWALLAPLVFFALAAVLSARV